MPRRAILFILLSFTFVLAGRVTAQTFTTLYSFDNGSVITGSVTNWGSGGPPSQLILSGKTLYGTTVYGGSLRGNGTVFAVNTDGTGFTNLHSFTALSDDTNDGAGPSGGLILSGNTLYGTAGGGSLGAGTIFAINTDGTGFTNLHNFTGIDGRNPSGGLILSGTTLYGTTTGGGSSGSGTIFAINTDGTGFTNLHKFTFTSYPNEPYTNSDGSYPVAGLILSGNTLYGTAVFGGSSGNGTVFAVNTDGTGFTTLHSFTTGVGYPNITNSEGANPWGGLILSGNTLYGTASSGGSSANGTMFAVNTDGTDFTNLHSFTGGSEGAAPEASLIILGNTLYGTSAFGGSSGNGSVFAINTDGTGFTNLYSFTLGVGYPYTADINSDGAGPSCRLILSGHTLYGTASAGGSFGHGTVFSLSFPPRLTILPFEANVILTWPTNVAGFDYTGFTLQSTTNPVSPAVWTSTSLVPVVVNGQNTVTNPISGIQQFFRLSQFFP
jgi:uncharacterized repeat protein (TIGR03803 family)